jgi:hypothetical protein
MTDLFVDALRQYLEQFVDLLRLSVDLLRPVLDQHDHSV